eukprot:459330-Pelagomonas_calceolata.AAC.1
MLKRLRRLVHVRPHADQFRSAAAVVACGESSLLAATASRGNCWFALDSPKLRRKSGFLASMICSCTGSAA